MPKGNSLETIDFSMIDKQIEIEFNKKNKEVKKSTLPKPRKLIPKKR